MENYKKGRNVEEELSKEHIPIEVLPENFLWMHVKGGTKVSNVVEYAQNVLRSGEYTSIVWSGSGGGVPKTISCVEIMKRNFNLNQVTRLSYQKIEEFWDPLLNGLEQIVVTRRVPAIHILLTLDEIDPKITGHQKTNVPTKFWPSNKETHDNDYVFKQKRNNGNNNANSRGKGNQNYRQKNQNSAKKIGEETSQKRKNINKKNEDKSDLSYHD
ncbi:hypothetical protein PVAND_008200 [Polypedilum vanderplanki]|uniref:DNA/RNA-binding protein Alba-like domain-containing protein n=1 Tax=Polypedilum vanderplanki TaxID=319348 RepID=A0A9J6C9D6_POLVA|nr:hypothetical protein PVAND_008200 [Polypedilum vanderplanki]